MKRIKSLTLFNVFSLFIYAGLFYGIHYQLLNQTTVREITNPYYSLFVPGHSISFGAWGVLYTALMIFCLYHIRMAFTHHERYPANRDVRRMDMFFIITNMAGIGWVLTTMKGLLMASLILIGFQLILLVFIHRELNIYTRYRRFKSTLCTQVPLSIYAAWLSLLLIGGASEYFDLSSDSWNLVLIGTLIFISLVVMFIRHNILFGLMMIPSLYGIILKVELPVMEDRTITLAAWTGIWILCLASVLKLVIDFRIKESPVIYKPLKSFYPNEPV